MDARLQESEIEEIVSAAQRAAGSPPVPWLLPRKAVVLVGGRRWKVRLYPTEDEAAQQERYLRLAAPALGVPTLAARRRECLLFSWPEVDPVHGGDQDAAEAIGEFLAQLNGMASPEVSAQSLMEEVATWLDRLVDVHLVSPRARGWIWRRLTSLRSEPSHIRLEYLDAMPHNFGRIGGELVLLDEKHLRPAFAGAGLVKPRLVLPAGSFQAMQRGYARRAGDSLPGNPAAFLDIYYFIHALHFNAQRMSEGVEHLPAVARCRRYRRWLISRVAPSRVAEVLENLQFIAAFPVDAARFAWSKLRFFLMEGTRAADDPLSPSP